MDWSSFLDDGHLLMGCGGSIAVLDLHRYVVHLKAHFCKQINIILTDTAASMIRPDVVSAYTGCGVYTTATKTPDFPAPHVSLTRWADLFLIMPTSANIIAKVAGGIADDLLTSAILASDVPVVFVPMMNRTMWNKKAVARNVKQLVEDGYTVVEPTLDTPSYQVASGATVHDGLSFDLSDVCRVMEMLLIRENLLYREPRSTTEN